MDDSLLKNDFSLRIYRLLNASRERVFQAWTQADALTQWFAPTDGFKTVVTELELLVGGHYRIEMHNPEGEIHTVFGELVSISPPEQLIFTWAWENSEDQSNSLVTVDLIEREGGTELVLNHERLASRASADLHDEGWTGCLDRLEKLMQ